MTRTIVIGTGNQDKVREVRHALAGIDLKLLDLAAFPDVSEAIEDADTLEANARLKALHYAQQTGHLVISDDSGLEVDALDGQPGVYSSRFAGDNVTYEQNTQKLLEVMKGVPESQRGARFRCVIAVAVGNRVLLELEGACEGRITTQVAGTQGFGYDLVFFHPGQGKTFAEMTLEVKNQLSHRARALAKLSAELEKILRTISS